MTTFLTLLHLALFCLVSLRVLSRNQLDAHTRSAWILVLLALPFLGLILYLLIGEIHFSGPDRRRIDAAVAATRPAVLASGSAPDLPRWGPASGFATSINGFGMTQGNRAELLDSPDGARARMIEDMDAATESISVLYYIWLEDQTGRNVAEAMIRAAGRGVRCRAMIDAIGSHSFIASDTWRRMKEAGVGTSVTLPLGNPLRTIFQRRPDLRNHRKITVIDGRICHCGSQNCADPAFLPKAKFAPWVDVMARYEGPVAHQMNLLFAQNWLADDPGELADFTRPVAGFEDGFPAQAVGTGPNIGRNVAAQLFARVIGTARREVIITTPYFVPGEEVCSAILAAAFAGARVTLIVPRRNDSGFVAPASRSFYPQLTEAGVTIAEYQGGLLHSKIITVDGETTFMGSSNMDIRSFGLNFENDILLHDRNFTAAIRRRQMEYLASAVLVTPEEVRGWSIARRIWNNAFATIGPLL
ncbi:phospholipase D-like domain-containing protein [Tabrizicola sp.]|uniref:phospholipase D-like domain-containing protein n=1 Tax=Tabrizicola sp. TaxID=2005166 RepID=UPI002FDD8183